MSRYFNYLDNLNEFNSGFVIVKRIISDIFSLDESLLDENDKKLLLEIKHEVISIDEQLGDNSYDFYEQINHDLISKENVEYCFEHGMYKDDASSTGIKMNKLYGRVFELEDIVQRLVAKMWKKMITPFNDIVNGEPFTVVGHSGVGYIVTPLSKRYVYNDYYNTESYSCSIFTDKNINCFNSKLVMLFDINETNFISASSFDSATSKCSDNTKSVKTMHIGDNGKAIIAGFTYNSSPEKVVTKVENPKKLLEKINNSGKNINETIISKKSSMPTGLIIFSSGYDFPLIEYIHAREMMYDYNLKLKVINQSLYSKKVITNEDIEQLRSDITKTIDYIRKINMSSDELMDLLDSFIDDVIIPLKLDSNILSIILEYIEHIKKSVNTTHY